MQDNISQALVGMNLDALPQQITSGTLTYSLNAVTEGFSNNMSIGFMNDRGNTLCITFPAGYKTLGVYNVTNINTSVFWLTNPTTGDSEIGTVQWDSCEYKTLVSDVDNDCKFGFNINTPIRKVVQKTTNCSTQLYWRDPIRRYIDLDDLPWKEEINPDNSFKPNKLVGKLDCNKLNVQPNFNIPEITPLEVVVGGELVMGTYQFGVQYANALGEGYTSVYNITNPLGIFEQKFTADFNLSTSKAISLKISNLDTSGLYDYFNLVVIKTINNIPTVELVGTFPVAGKGYTYTYTGSDKSPIKLDYLDIFEKFPYYSTAGDVYSTDNRVGWSILTQDEEINYQKIWSKVQLQWETYQIPYNQFQGYSNGVNTADYRGYMRDEVYALEGCFLLKNGKQTRAFHIPSRVYNGFDIEPIDVDNKDNAFSTTNPCDKPVDKLRWEVYNTADKVDFTEEFKNKNTSDDCYVGPYEYGNFSYWQSQLKYPNNRDIWGDLANTPIRHHKFPDSSLIPIFDNVPDTISQEAYKSFEHHIYPIGIRVVISTLNDAINDSDLTQQEREQIVGFKILRGNRAANKSIIAKGILHNVGFSSPLDIDNTTPNGEGYYYPNYPYNDLRRDPYFSSTKVSPHEGFNYSRTLEGFYNDADSSRSRFVFHSPDTHFYQPSLDNQGEYLNLYNIIYGKSYSHFTKVKDNAEYKFLTPNTIYAAAALAIAGGFTIGAGTFGSPTFSAGSVPSTYEGATELFNKLVPYTNFGYSFNSVGFYGNSYPIPNEGDKIRGIDYNKYLIEGVQTIEDGKLLNNVGRETSVYIKANNAFKFTHEYSTMIPQDESRYNIAIIKGAAVASDIPQYITQVTLTIDDNARNSTPAGTIYNIAGKKYKVLSSNFSFDFTNPTGGSHYTGYVNLTPLESTSPPATGTAVIDPSSAINISSGIPNLIVIFHYSAKEEILVPNPEYKAPEQATANLSKIRDNNISSYYGGIKKYIPAQWGDIYSYETIDTGYFHLLKDEQNNQFNRVPAVFGGDIFINRFAYKSKLPFFKDNTVKANDQTDVAYDELGTIAWPMFWLSTKPTDFKIDINHEVKELAAQVFKPTVGSVLLNIFTGSGLGTAKVQAFLRKVFKEIYERIGIKNINLDQSYVEGIAEQGLMYLFAYGVPYFFCESEVNVDYRQAYNEREGNFFPNVSSNIPDDWFQEVNVPITYDNTYTYNQTYSKQNKENSFAHLREDFDPLKVCYTLHPNRTIWSDTSSLEETKNNWLIYRPSSYKDLPKTYGDLVSIDSLEHNQLLVRFEDRSQIYNALTTVDVKNGLPAYLGSADLFSSQPLDLSATTVGYAGSQNQLLLNTEFGHVFVDTKRGQVILLKNNEVEDLAERGADKFFSDYLPFTILNSFPEVPTDNSFNGIGVTGTYDTYYKRLLLTKIDYTPLAGVTYDSTSQSFSSGGQRVDLSDTNYFINRSWTISYSFKTQSWISFHSFTPNYYIPFPNYFQTGINNTSTVWEHNRTFTLFNNYYGTLYPYIIEYPYAYKYLDEVTQSIKDYTECRVYSDFYTYHTPDTVTYFNEALLYNNQQCTGPLNLIPKVNNKMSQFLSYPKYNTDSKDILVAKADNFYNFNQFWDIVKSNNQPFLSTSPSFPLSDKVLDNSNLDFTRRDFKKNQMRGKDLKVRLKLSDRDSICLISHFINNQTSNSYL